MVGRRCRVTRRKRLVTSWPKAGFWAFGADGFGVELEGLQGLAGDRAISSPVGREQPGQVGDVAAAQVLDDHPAVSGDEGIQCDLAGLDEPEPVSGAALLTQAVPDRELDGLGVRRQQGDMVPGQYAQEMRENPAWLAGSCPSRGQLYVSGVLPAR